MSSASIFLFEEKMEGSLCGCDNQSGSGFPPYLIKKKSPDRNGNSNRLLIVYQGLLFILLPQDFEKETSCI
jgi:hypothetical protein